MHFFIDTANVEEIRMANEMGIIWLYSENKKREGKLWDY